MPRPLLDDGRTARNWLVKSGEKKDEKEAEDEIEEKDREREGGRESEDEEMEEAGEWFGEGVLQRTEASHFSRSESVGG